MSVSARLVVVEGPDLGAEFLVPASGAGIGRGAENLVRLTDETVSRSHCALEPAEGGLVVVDLTGRQKLLVNGEAVARRAFGEGDVIEIGRTRIAHLPGSSSASRTKGKGTSITAEVAASELSTSAPKGSRRSLLGALVRLGEGLRSAVEKADLLEHAQVVLRDALDAATTSAVTLDPQGAVPDLPQSLVQRVLEQKTAVLEVPAPDRQRIVAPLLRGAEVQGLLIASRSLGGSPAWDDATLELVACAAHLVGVSLEALDARATLTRTNRALEDRVGIPSFVGASPGAKEIVELVAKVAKSDATVLVYGESGVGKELVAHAIHRQSRRARGPFVAVNCAALTESVLESELFGHEKGAFTGATERRIGRFELAEGGTLFLDEVAEISPKCQAKFLRVLEERRLERVGGSRSIAVDVRVVAATNRDLEKMIATGEFREDLFFRLGVIRATVPPLRDRADDIPMIATELLARLRAQAGRRVTGFSTEAMAALKRYPWPGNVRELRNAIEHAIVLGDEPTIGAADLPAHVREGPRARSAGAEGDEHHSPAGRGIRNEARTMVGPAPVPGADVMSMKDLEREGILRALESTKGNKAKAATLLGIDRSTLYKKLREYGLIGGDGD